MEGGWREGGGGDRPGSVRGRGVAGGGVGGGSWRAGGGDRGRGVGVGERASEAGRSGGSGAGVGGGHSQGSGTNTWGGRGRRGTAKGGGGGGAARTDFKGDIPEDPRTRGLVETALAWARSSGETSGSEGAQQEKAIAAMDAIRNVPTGSLSAGISKLAAELVVEGCIKLAGSNGVGRAGMDERLVLSFFAASHSLLRQEGVCPDSQGCSRAVASLLSLIGSQAPQRILSAYLKTLATLLHTPQDIPPPLPPTIDILLPLMQIPLSSDGSISPSCSSDLSHAANALSNACVRAGPLLQPHIVSLASAFTANMQASVGPWLAGAANLDNGVGPESLLASNVRGLQLLLTECCTSSELTAQAARMLQEADQGRLLRRLCEVLVEICCSDAYFTPRDEGTSEVTSGYSSSETEGMGRLGPAGRVHGVTGGKLRMYSLLAVQAVAKIQPRCLHPHWQVLFPTDQKRVGRSVTLVGIMSSDPAPKVRSLAAVAIQAVLQRSRTYMAAAEDRRASTFTSLSQTLAIIIRATHKGLCAAVLGERHPATAQQMVKALSTLAANAPYSRMKSGLVGDAVEALMRLLAEGAGVREDVALRTAALSCIGTLLDSPLALEELEAAGMKGKGDELLEVVLSIAFGAAATPVRVEAWRALGSLSRRGMGMVTSRWGDVLEGITKTLRNAPPPVRVHAARAIELLVGAADDREEDGEQEAVVAHSPQPSPQRGAASARDPAVTAESGGGGRLPDEVWVGIVQSLVPLMMQDDHPPVRASAISAIAAVPFHIPGSAACLDHVWAAAKPGDPSEMPLRAAALRSLGVLAHEEPHKDDVQVLIRMAGALDMCSRDPNLQVRMRAGWALASLCENPTVIREASKSDYVRHHAGLTLLRLAELSLRLMADNDKVRVYGARAMGNLGSPAEFVKFIAGSTSEDGAYQLCSRIESELCRVISSPTFSVKVRWNACHAAGLLLANPLTATSKPPWGSRLLEALGAASEGADNFKVRTQATRGLRYAVQRATHVTDAKGEVDAAPLVARWRLVMSCSMGEVSGLDSSQYKYRDTLRLEQHLCVLQLTSLLRPGDLPPGCISLEDAACVLESLRSLIGSPQADTLSGPAASSLCTLICLDQGTVCGHEMSDLLVQLKQFANGSAFANAGREVNPFGGGARLSKT